MEENEDLSLTAQQKIVMKWLEKGNSVLILGFTATGKSFLLEKFRKTISSEKKDKILLVDNVRKMGKEQLEALKQFKGQRVVVMSQYESDSDNDNDPKPCSTICLKNKRVYECFDKIAYFRRPYVRDRELEYNWDSNGSNESSESDNEVSS